MTFQNIFDLNLGFPSETTDLLDLPIDFRVQTWCIPFDIVHADISERISTVSRDRFQEAGVALGKVCREEGVGLCYLHEDDKKHYAHILTL